jgi:hypothetical protein
MKNKYQANIDLKPFKFPTIARPPTPTHPAPTPKSRRYRSTISPVWACSSEVPPSLTSRPDRRRSTRPLLVATNRKA